MKTTDGNHRLSGRLCLLPLVVWIIIAAVGYVPTKLLAGWNGVQAMFAAQAMVTAIVYLTLIPAMWQMAGAEKPQQLKIAFKVVAVRFIITLLAIVIVVWQGFVHTTVFLVWSAVAYLMMIKMETLILVKWSNLSECRQ